MTFACKQTLTGAGTGTSSQTARLDAAVYFRTPNSPCQFQIKSDGYVYVNDSGTLTQRYQWLTGSGTNADYQCRSTVTGGTPGTFTTDPSGGAWLACSTSRTWERSSPGIDKNVIATFEIRMAAGPNTVLATASITLDCEAAIV